MISSSIRAIVRFWDRSEKPFGATAVGSGCAEVDGSSAVRPGLPPDGTGEQAGRFGTCGLCGLEQLEQRDEDGDDCCLSNYLSYVYHAICRMLRRWQGL
jgi:hypothetical protein